MTDPATARKVGLLLAGRGVRITRAWRYGCRGVVQDDGAEFVVAIYSTGAFSCACGARHGGPACAHLIAAASVASRDLEAALALGEAAEARTA